MGWGRVNCSLFVPDRLTSTARFARVVVPGRPHHVTQRGNRREPIFFENGDHDVYGDIGVR